MAGMENIKEALTKKIGPLPGYAWAGIGVGGFVLYKKLHGSSAAAATGVPTDPNAAGNALDTSGLAAGVPGAAGAATDSGTGSSGTDTTGAAIGGLTDAINALLASMVPPPPAPAPTTTPDATPTQTPDPLAADLSRILQVPSYIPPATVYPSGTPNPGGGETVTSGFATALRGLYAAQTASPAPAASAGAVHYPSPAFTLTSKPAVASAVAAAAAQGIKIGPNPAIKAINARSAGLNALYGL